MSHQHELDVGDIVVDRHVARDGRNDAVVVNTPPKRAHEWTVPGGRGTVADDNPQYAEDAMVAVVMYRDALDDAFPYYSGVAPLTLSDLHADGLQYYAFPEARLYRKGSLGTHDLLLEDLQPAPWHARNFDVDANRAFIAEIRERGHPDPAPLVRARETDAGEYEFQLVNGHKRVWASHVAGLESIPCYCVHQEDGEYAKAWAKRHLEAYDREERAVALDRLESDFETMAQNYAVGIDGGRSRGDS